MFGCIGLRNKKYCVLNKQYTKEDYFDLVPKIKEQMMDVPYVDKGGRVYRYGEFFPIELSPFAYNETVAQDYFPLTEQKATELAYAWKAAEVRTYVPTVDAVDLPDDIHSVDETILNEIIRCAHAGVCRDRCSTAFKILKDELIFYKRFTIPLPRLCYGCRHAERFSKRNPLKLGIVS